MRSSVGPPDEAKTLLVDLSVLCMDDGSDSGYGYGSLTKNRGPFDASQCVLVGRDQTVVCYRL
jgi:hypothetical protein